MNVSKTALGVAALGFATAGVIVATVEPANSVYPGERDHRSCVSIKEYRQLHPGNIKRTVSDILDNKVSFDYSVKDPEGFRIYVSHHMPLCHWKGHPDWNSRDAEVIVYFYKGTRYSYYFYTKDWTA